MNVGSGSTATTEGFTDLRLNVFQAASPHPGRGRFSFFLLPLREKVSAKLTDEGVKARLAAS
jgi:hypothetical protein